VAAPSFIELAGWAPQVPITATAHTAPQQTCLINFMAYLHTGRTNPAWRDY
jgi:hypothetical protein